MNQKNSISALLEEGTTLVRPRKTLAKEAADTLREYILLGKLAPGTAVPERDLAEVMGISRTPLREALQLLETEGLIEYSKTRRPFVANPSHEELFQFIKVLGALEALGGELACIEATDAEIQEIVDLNASMSDQSAQLEPLDFFRMDMDFHSHIIAASRNAPLIETHRQYNARLWRARFISSRRPTRRDGTLQEHAGITKALINRDSQVIAKAMRSHLNTTIDNIDTAPTQ
ncbi:MAG: transcriptional regulator [Hyphomicrobiales bacterium]|nr:MAG: transcriptional regulator [Hyphomicrobiales bacterium]